MRVRDAVVRVKARLDEFQQQSDRADQSAEPEPINPYDVAAFQAFLYHYRQDRLVDELMTKRGLSERTIKTYRLGHTGTHFAIPVFGLDGGIQTIRYRADEAFTDKGARDFSKYAGTRGHNSPLLYPLPVVSGSRELAEAWIVEGEFDAMAGNQAGHTTLTITNGANMVSRIPEMLKEVCPGLLVKRWIIATDQDKAGEAAAKKLLDSLPGQSVRARWPEAKDLCEYYAMGGSKRKISYETEIQDAGTSK